MLFLFRILIYTYLYIMEERGKSVFYLILSNERTNASSLRMP